MKQLYWKGLSSKIIESQLPDHLRANQHFKYITDSVIQSPLNTSRGITHLPRKPVWSLSTLMVKGFPSGLILPSAVRSSVVDVAISSAQPFAVAGREQECM